MGTAVSVPLAEAVCEAVCVAEWLVLTLAEAVAVAV